MSVKSKSILSHSAADVKNKNLFTRVRTGKKNIDIHHPCCMSIGYLDRSPKTQSSDSWKEISNWGLSYSFKKICQGFGSGNDA